MAIIDALVPVSLIWIPAGYSCLYQKGCFMGAKVGA